MIAHYAFLSCYYKTVRSLTTSLSRQLVVVCTGPFPCPIHAHQVMVGTCVDLKRLNDLGSTSFCDTNKSNNSLSSSIQDFVQIQFFKTHCLTIITGKTHLQIKFKRLPKVLILIFG